MMAIIVISMRKHSKVLAHTASHNKLDPKCRNLSTMKRLLIIVIKMLICRMVVDTIMAVEKDLDS